MNGYFQKDGKKKIAGCVLLAAGFVLLSISRISHGFADWYSEHIYALLVGSLGRIAGIVPFSVAEMLLYVLIISVIIGVVARRKQWLWGFFLLACLLFFLYAANCGINYNRESFSEMADIPLEEYSAEELEAVCLWLTEEVNGLSVQIKRDENGLARLDGEKRSGKERLRGETEKKVAGSAAEAMQRLGDEYEGLAGHYPRPKGLKVPWILSVQQLSGVYSPFTIEANYNTAMVDYYIPFTMCHELSHLRGFMQEEEANFIAFLACCGSEEEEFRYSGALVGWTYCMNVLYRADYERWEIVRERLSPLAETDLAANREFWSSYDGAVAEVSNKVNDTYLKANGQSDGVKSYNRMVDLIVSHYAKRG